MLEGCDSVRFSTKSLLYTVLITAVVVASISELARRGRHHSTAMPIVNGLKGIRGALRIYETSAGSMPLAATLDSNGEQLCSWRYRLLPLFEDLGTVIDFDKPWDGKENAKSRSLRASAYCYNPQSSSLQTDVFAVTGPDTLFDSSRPTKLSDVDNDLIVAMEASNSNVHWMQPGDYELSKLERCTGKFGDCVTGLIHGRVHVLFADGQVWSLSSDTPMDAIKAFLTINGSESHSRERELSEYMIDRWK